MTTELKIPDVGESVREVQIGRWLKREGDSIEQDENLVELETDKASLELPAPSAGVMGKILKNEGDIVAVGEVIAYIEQDGVGSQRQAAATKSKPAPESSSQTTDRTDPSTKKPLQNKTGDDRTDGRSQPMPPQETQPERRTEDIPVTPAARRALRVHGLTAADIDSHGDRIESEDVLRHIEELEGETLIDKKAKSAAAQERPIEIRQIDGELEEAVPMSLIRRRIAERLLQAQQQAALLTTFNEVDMTAVQRLRTDYRESFQEKYGVKLGIMSFFVKAVVDALKERPELNAEIRDDQIVYRRYYHIGIAVGSAKALVVPVLRFAERLSFAEIEQAIDDFARRAAENKLEPHELDGGTFTITNGGVFGSLLSTPTVNPPQSGILGMHAIQDRPVARAGEVVIRPMMYVALTYDHRLVDGREAVTFLRRIKDVIEEPSRMVLEV